ncbi:triple tyrosine motif-containing protein [Massilia sp. CFBP9012]|uniref:sensor histidine kinase n=1 Tax=Massilia sp. CFBP9012 TaxID=3096531 RepID=UPI002A6A4C54|nr:triple tyrosine motif-containing protein [Massilia sp. CFBP9012]MDY0976183.1 triple tyrosine motif-containing protein [Massilia sp. CFBP9012]
MVLPNALLRLLPACMVALALFCTPAGARGLKDYQRIAWTQEQGAPSNIMSMAQTTDGWLWVGSDDGLFRFDGVSFEPYLPPGPRGSAHARVVDLHAADNGDLYVSFFPNDVAVIGRDGSFTLLPSPDEFRKQPPGVLVLDHDGSLWTIGHGIRRFANGRWTTVENDPAWVSGDLYSMLLDQDGRLWAAAQSGTWLLDRARGRFDKVSDQGGGLALSPDGAPWVIGRHGGPAVRLAGSLSGKPRPARAGAVVSRVAGQFAADGTLWALGCPDTACLVHDVARHPGAVDPRRAADERIASDDGAQGKEFPIILEDRERNIWINANGTLHQFRPKRFLVPAPKLDLTDYFYSLAATGDRQFWVAETVSGTLWRLGPDGAPVAEPGEPVRMLASGRDGALLKADKHKITRVRGDSAEIIPLPPGRDGKPVDRQLFGMLDDGKRLWTSSLDTGPIAWTDGKWQTGAQLGLPIRIYFLQADGPGQLWLVHLDDTLVHYDNGKLTPHGKPPVGTVTGIFPGTQLVIGGAEGLAVLRDGKFHLLSSSDPDALRGVSGIAVTANGDRWLNGVRGVVHVRAADWQRALERPGALLRHELFGASDGYPGRSSVMWRVPSAFSPDGRHVWFLGTRGIVGLDSADLHRNAAPPTPVVLDLSTETQRFAAAADLRLPPGSQDFRVRFTAPSLRQPERIRFEYRLDGFDAAWRDGGNRRTTSYTNVAPGDYVLRVRAFNEDGVASRQDATLPITIEPTLAQSLAFRVALALLLLALLVLLYRLRVRHLGRRILERAEIKLSERERIARTLHDSFLQSLYLLILRLRKIEARLPEHETARHELRTVLGEAQGVMDEGREQVHELRARTGRTLADTVRECASGLQVIHPEVRFALHEQAALAELDQALIDEAGAIACEALRNAFTHAQARNIAVQTAVGKRELVLTVSDDGRGMAPAVLAAGLRDGHWGMVGMHERAARIGARLDIRSDAASGTIVTLAIPLDRRTAPAHAESRSVENMK